VNGANSRILLVNINSSQNSWNGTDPIEDGNYEAWNFNPINGHYYGAFPKKGRVNIACLGGGTTDAFVNGITVVWVVKKKTVVGWYVNATVFATGQGPPAPNRYRATCLVQDGRVLDESERTFDVEAAGIRFGQFPRRYPNVIEDGEFIDRVRQYIDSKRSSAP
jgi:hypothetical protein